jgi:putative hydrolase of the HAD superfamily
MIRAVLFDLWGTLVLDPSSTSEPRLADRTQKVVAVFEAAGLPSLTPGTQERLARLSQALADLHDTGIDIDGPGRVELFMRDLGVPVDVLSPAARAELETAITTIEPAFYPEPEPHAEDLLRTLKQRGLRTGLISNAGFTTAPTLRDLLAYHRLDVHLDVMLFSDEHALAKPTRDLFERAVATVGVAVHETVFVGDTPWNDIQGAQQAGMVAVQIGAKTRDGIRPDLQITSLAELLPRLSEVAILEV